MAMAIGRSYYDDGSEYIFAHAKTRQKLDEIVENCLADGSLSWGEFMNGRESGNADAWVLYLKAR
jgi:hypothetical protein